MRHFPLRLLASDLPVTCLSTLPDSGDKALQSRRQATPTKRDANLYHIGDKFYHNEQPVAEDGEAIAKLGIQNVTSLRFFDRNDDNHLEAYGLNY